MITRHHLTLTLLFTPLLCYAFFPGDLILACLVVIGAETGAILPDIQMKKPSRVRLLTGAYYVTQISRLICVPALCAACRLFLSYEPDKTDKRLTHSLPGITCIFLSFAVILVIPARVMQNAVLNSFIPVFLGGLALGLILHLVLDLCTRKGIFPLFPFSMFRIKGSIRPCDMSDHRIRNFHVMILMILIAVMALATTGTVPPDMVITTCTGCLVAVIGWMMIVSGVQVVPDRDPGDTAGSRFSMSRLPEG
jgi:hypothetical protein